ncbi:MAG: flagellar motor switch protein FliN [Chitinispirillaceae bacterium]|nr:flagellar motor switch protein FliN [Chitinispirillaceae bacterium]
MSDILSQDQIDALLNSQGFNDGGDGDRPVDPEKERAAVLKTFGLFCEQAGTVISTVLNKKVSFHTDQCVQASPAAIQEKLPSVLLAVKLPLTSGVAGELFLVIQKTDVAVLSDLMMMGDGTAEYTEDHKDAIGELFNQVMRAFTNALSSEWGDPVASGTIEVAEFDIDHTPVPLENYALMLAVQAVEGKEESHIALLVPRELSAQLAEKAKIVDAAEGGPGADRIGLNTAELDDLSKVTSFADGGNDEFRDAGAATGGLVATQQNIDMLLDIDLDVSIELGKTNLSIKRILELAPGSIVELDRMAGEPVDLMVNNKVVAKGEVVVIDENFGIRIVSLVSPEERIRSLR